MLTESQLAQIPVFDSLIHINENGKWFNTQLDASYKNMYQQCFIDLPIKKGLLVGLPENDLEMLLAIAKRHADVLIPIAPLESKYQTNLLEAFTQLKQLGFRGIKIHPRILNINLQDNLIVEAIQCAHELGLISLLCTIHRYPSLPIKMPISEALYEICLKTKNAKIIFLHGGYYDLLATSELLRPFENTILDLSTTLLRFQNSHLLETIIYLFESFDKRICIGSDFPEYTMKDVLSCISAKILAHTRLEKGKLLNILSGNLMKFMEDNLKNNSVLKNENFSDLIRI